MKIKKDRAHLLQFVRILLSLLSEYCVALFIEFVEEQLKNCIT